MVTAYLPAIIAINIAAYAFINSTVNSLFKKVQVISFGY